MSYNLAFWKQKPSCTASALEIYEKLLDAQTIDDLESVPTAEFIQSVHRRFPGISTDGELMFWDGGNRGMFELKSSDQHVHFSCREMGNDDMKVLIEIASGFECPLYDPQADWRSDGLVVDVTPGGMIAVKHQWPSEPIYRDGKQKGFYNLDTFLTIHKAPAGKSHYFWGQQFWFVGGDGGYMGLQTGGSLRGKEPKIAIFSIWKALDAKEGNGTDAFAGPFGGEGTGYSCKIAYDWNEGTEYRLRLWEIADAHKPAEPEWWGAWVMDMSTKQETFIGQIQVPADWKWMSSNTNFFVEYFLSVPSCGQLPYTKASLHTLTRENGTVHPTGIPTLETYGKCKFIASVRLCPDNSVICETGQ